MAKVTNCQLCGKSIEAKQGRKYCQECNDAIRGKSIARTVKRRPMVSRLTEKEQAARAAGLSYGQYIARRSGSL